MLDVAFLASQTTNLVRYSPKLSKLLWSSFFVYIADCFLQGCSGNWSCEENRQRQSASWAFRTSWDYWDCWDNSRGWRGGRLKVHLFFLPTHPNSDDRLTRLAVQESLKVQKPVGQGTSSNNVFVESTKDGMSNGNVGFAAAMKSMGLHLPVGNESPHLQDVTALRVK